MDTILVVEDEAFLSFVVSDELQDVGYHVLTAGNADHAIALLKQNQIRCIFTDIDMPGGSMDGLTLAADVRRRWPSIDIIITTGKSQPKPNRMPIWQHISVQALYHISHLRSRARLSITQDREHSA